MPAAYGEYAVSSQVVLAWVPAVVEVVVFTKPTPGAYHRTIVDVWGPDGASEERAMTIVHLRAEYVPAGTVTDSVPSMVIVRVSVYL